MAPKRDSSAAVKSKSSTSASSTNPLKSSGNKASGGAKGDAAAAKEKKRITVSSIVVEDKKGGAKPSSISGNASKKAPSKRVKPVNDYLAGVDLPPSDDDEEEEMGFEVGDAIREREEREKEREWEEGEKEETREERASRRERGNGMVVNFADPTISRVTEKQLKKKEKKELLLAQFQEEGKKEREKEDEDEAISVVLGAKNSAMDGEKEAGTGGSDANAKDVKVESFSVSARGKELFKNASLTIVHGKRYGLVGPNGKGKSTLMKLIAKRRLPVPRNIDVLLVEQEVVADETSALQAVVSADVELSRLRAEEERLRKIVEAEGEAEEKREENKEAEEEGEWEEVGGREGEGKARDSEELATELDAKASLKGKKSKESRKEKKRAEKRGKEEKGGDKEKRGREDREEGEEEEAELLSAGEQLTSVYERMREIGGEAAEARASKILAGLGFDKAMQTRSTKSFSGGWRMRISLARALFLRPTLLLLDEPTNHLDLRAVLWLEEYLMRWKNTLIVVSHDRDFLNSVCTEVIHLHDEKLYSYKGNFDSFEEMYEKKRREMNKKFETYEKQMLAAKKSGNREKQDKVRERAAMAAQKDSKKKRGKHDGADDDEAESAVDSAPKRWRDYAVEFHFPEPTELSPPLLSLKEVSFSYPNRPDFALTGLDLAIDMGSRVAIVGPNGAGKSTLLNLLAGDLTPSQGEARKSQKLRIGRYSQHFIDLLTFNETPVEYLLRLFPNQEGPSRQEAVRSKLGKFGLPSHNHLTPIMKLSGGQKARVVFTSISFSRPHILLLDEPTNHLDMQSIDALADALDEFTGGVILVSHDSRLISRVCDDEERSEIWVVDEGTCRKFPGSFEDYKSKLVKEIIAEVEE